jgi:KaiC/GvpD/RAD55 family RecA-like ATPase
MRSCSNHAQFLDHVTKFIGDALKAGDGTIVMATESHRASVLARLQAYGMNVDKAMVQGRYIALDASTDRGLTESSGEVFSLDILSPRMSVIGMFPQLSPLLHRATHAFICC